MSWVQRLATCLVVITLTAACSGDEPDWRADLIELSASPHAASLYYSEQLNESNVESTMADQCAAIDAAFQAYGDTNQLFKELQISMGRQFSDGVPRDVIERDFAALGEGMAEMCPSVHTGLVEYLGFDDFARLPGCKVGTTIETTQECTRE